MRPSPTRPKRWPTNCVPTTAPSTTRSIEIDLDALKPLINGPHSPDRANRVGAAVGAEARANDWPLEISAALIGSCTNSSYEDITRAASIARQAAARGLTVRTPLLVSPGSEQTRATVERDGLIADLEAIGATVLANACGPCIGQWDRPADAIDKPNTIVNSFNRNFPKRNDGSANTLSFVTSPRHRGGAGPRRQPRLRPHHRHHHRPRRQRGAAERPRGRGAAGQGLRPGPEHVHAASRGWLGRGGRGVRHQRPPPAPAAVPGVGRQRLPRPARADEGQGQVHHRPHLGGRQVADLPRSPGEHLRQPVPRCGQRLRQGRRQRVPGGYRQGRPRRRRRHLPEPGEEVQPGRRALGGHRRPQLRRGFERASTPRWSPASAAAW